MVVAVNQAWQKGLVTAVNRPVDSFDLDSLFPSNCKNFFPFDDDTPLFNRRGSKPVNQYLSAHQNTIHRAIFPVQTYAQ
jgi:hypothetical protein